MKRVLLALTLAGLGLFIVATMASSAPRGPSPAGVPGFSPEVSRRSLPLNPTDTNVMTVWHNGECKYATFHVRKTEVRHKDGSVRIEETDADPTEVERQLGPRDPAKANIRATPQQVAACDMWANVRGNPNLPAPPPIMAP